VPCVPGLERDGVPVVERDDERDLVSFKCLDPDGWRVECTGSHRDRSESRRRAVVRRDVPIWLPSLSTLGGRSSPWADGGGARTAGHSGGMRGFGRSSQRSCGRRLGHRRGIGFGRRGRFGSGVGWWRRLTVESGLWLIRRVDRRGWVGRAGCHRRPPIALPDSPFWRRRPCAGRPHRTAAV
jgi:hypothetical protein